MIAIVGGGISGLAAAFELQRQRVDFRLFEKSRRLGGLILTEDVDGLIIEAGPDALLVQKPAAIELCRELGLNDHLVPTSPPRTAYIVRNRKLHPIPERSFLGIPLTMTALARCGFLSAVGKARLAAERFVTPRTSAEDESIADFMQRRFGREAVDYLAEPLLAGIHAGDVKRLSMQALFPRLPEAEKQYGSVLRALGKTERPRSAEGAFLSLDRGLGDLVTALERALPGSAVEREAGVTRIAFDATSRDYLIHTARREPVRARGVILTTPAYVTGTLLQDLDPHLAEHCRAIPYVSTASVSLAYRREAIADPIEGVGFLVPSAERLHILAASWVSSKWPGRAPPHLALLRVFVGSARDTEILRRSDEELVRVAHEELSQLMRIREWPSVTRVYRWERASAQHDVGHLEHVRTIERKLERFQGLTVTGSGFRGVGIPDCISDARRTAELTAARICTSR
ncbi:MAG: protoporphyrinogen oxidase [Acidobacteria bacterium]|nr:protoporphyrinogen oxidase [Acidobacteriota bacterium]